MYMEIIVIITEAVASLGTVAIGIIGTIIALGIYLFSAYEFLIAMWPWLLGEILFLMFIFPFVLSGIYRLFFHLNLWLYNLDLYVTDLLSFFIDELCKIILVLLHRTLPLIFTILNGYIYLSTHDDWHWILGSAVFFIVLFMVTILSCDKVADKR